MSDRPDRNAVVASYWQFDPEADGDAEVEAMPAAISFSRSEIGEDARVMLSVRGKPGRRYERHDSAWLELTDAEALHLIQRLSAALQETSINGVGT